MPLAEHTPMPMPEGSSQEVKRCEQPPPLYHQRPTVSSVVEVVGDPVVSDVLDPVSVHKRLRLRGGVARIDTHDVRLARRGVDDVVELIGVAVVGH